MAKLKMLKEHANTETAVDFNFFLKDFILEQRRKLFEAHKSEITELIEKASDFKAVLEYLAPEQRKEVFEALKSSKLPNIFTRGRVKSCFEFQIVLQHLAPEQRSEFFEALKPELPQLIKNVSDFNDILKYLAPEQRSELFEALKPKLPQLIKSASDFDDALQYLPDPDQKLFVDIILLNPLQIKCQQLTKGLTYLFFKDISQKKYNILSEIFDLTQTIITTENPSQNDGHLRKIKNIIKDNTAILKTHRGFFKFHETTSFQIANNLVDFLKDTRIEP